MYRYKYKRIMLSVTVQSQKGYTLPFTGKVFQMYQVNYVRIHFIF